VGSGRRKKSGSRKGSGSGKEVKLERRLGREVEVEVGN
jgi:hypothetical protein